MADLSHLFGEDVRQVVDGAGWLPCWIEYDWEHVPRWMSGFFAWSKSYWSHTEPPPYKRNARRFGRGK